MSLKAGTSTSGKVGAILWLVGWFCVFCGGVMLAAAGWRAFREHNVNSRWADTPARIQKCALDIDHPFARDGGGTVYSLRCRLRVEAASGSYDYDLATTSNRSEQSRQQIEEWVAENKAGTVLATKVNPSDPKDLLVVSILPIRQTETAQDGLVTALVFGAVAALFLATARKLGIPARA